MASMFNPSLRECSYKINVNLDARNNKRPQIYALSSFRQDNILWHQCLTHPSKSVLTKLMPV